jgi:hypothetical protein
MYWRSLVSVIHLYGEHLQCHLLGLPILLETCLVAHLPATPLFKVFVFEKHPSVAEIGPESQDNFVLFPIFYDFLCLEQVINIFTGNSRYKETRYNEFHVITNAPTGNDLAP